MTRADPPPRMPLFPVARWRGTLPVDPATRTTALSFTEEDGTVWRRRISIDDAHALRDTLGHFLAAHERAKAHSESSSGKPSVDVSTPLEGV